MKFTVKNDFHGTQATVIPRVKIAKGVWWISAKTVKRIQNELCGVDNCRCGDFLGARGKQTCDYEESWHTGRNDGAVFYEPVFCWEK